MTAGTLPGIGYHRSAVISADGLYRYELTRRWDTGRQGVLWVMLNPSRADADVDDQTVRRCVSFTRREGFDHLKIVNLYGLRATNPKELAIHPDPVGQLNFGYLTRALRNQRAYPLVVAAWGASTGPRCMFIPRPSGRGYHCLGTTKGGWPRHPSRLADSTPLEPWTMPDDPR